MTYQVEADVTPFDLGEPVWFLPDDDTYDIRTYVVIGHSKGMFGRWNVEIVRADCPTMHGFLVPSWMLTRANPFQLHVINGARTATGNWLTCIQGGLT